MKKQNNKAYKLLELIVNINTKYKEYSDRYSKTFIDLLEEESFSFGLKTFCNINNQNVDKIEKIFKSEAYSYYLYENYDIKYTTTQMVELIINESIYSNKSIKSLEKELLEIIIDNLKYLYKEDLKIGKILSLLITDLYDLPALYGFKPIDDCIKYLENELDSKIYKELNINKDTNELLDPAYCIFYWFTFENKFGKKELKVQLKNQDIFKIKNFNDFFKLIKLSLPI